VSPCDTDREAITERSSGRCIKGPPPVDPGELEFLAVDPVTRYASRAGTRAPYTRDYAAAQGGKPANYMLRRVNSKVETGPWSETATATIGA